MAIDEAKEVVEETFEVKADKVLDDLEKETPPGPSPEKKPEGEEAKAEEIPGAEPAKTERIKEVEEDASLSVEEKIGKVKEILGDDLDAIDAYVKEKGYHTDPAWQKQREIIGGLKEKAEQGALSEEDKRMLADAKEVTSSPEFIRLSMRKQGYTEEAIDQKLREKGHEIPERTTDDFALVVRKFGLDPKAITSAQKADILDIAKIADTIMMDRLGKILPGQLKPLQDHIGDMNQSASATKVMDAMRSTIKGEDILDFDKDIEPELNKFLDENKGATQEDLLNHFYDLNHRLSIERLKTGKRKEKREEKKGELRQISKGPGGAVTVPEKTGNFEKDADAILDRLGVA